MSTFTPINESKSLISLKKVSESTVSSTRKNGKKTQSTSIITQNSPHQRNNRIPLLTFSTLSNQRNTTLSTTFYQSTFTIPRLDLKIKQANENKKMKTMMKNEKNIKEIQARHEKLMQYKLKLKASKEEQKENQHRLDQMRKLKLKIFNILSRDTHSVCDDFQRKVNAFNIKLFEFLGGNFMKNQALKYNATFRFDKNEHGESHNRKKMIIDIDNLKQKSFLPDTILNQELTADEKKLILLDPNYFIKNNTYKQSKLLKIMPLSARLSIEEKPETKVVSEPSTARDFKRFQTFKDDLMKEKEKENKRKKKIIIASNTESKINEIDSMLHRSVYVNKTEQFKTKRNIKPSEYYEKVIKDMNYKTHTSFAKLQNNIYFVPNKKDEADSKRVIQKKISNIGVDYEKILMRFRRKNQRKRASTKDNDEMKGVDMNMVFSMNNLNHEEKEFVDRYNKIIKDEFLKKEPSKNNSTINVSLIKQRKDTLDINDTFL